MRDLFFDVEIETFKVTEKGRTHGINPFTDKYLCPYMRKYQPKQVINTGLTSAHSEEIDCIQCRIMIDHLSFDHANNIVRLKISKDNENLYKTIASTYNPAEVETLLNSILRTWDLYGFSDIPREEREAAAEKEKLQDLGEFMTTGEAAKKWNYGKTTIKRMLKRGDIDASMIAGRFAIPIDHPRPELKKAPNGKGKKAAAAAAKGDK